MASTQALFTAFSGLEAHSRFIDVAGNNIANVNTTAFKGSRVAFSDLLYRNTSIGEAPGTFTGGTNPSQVGTGVRVAGTLKDFAPGTISATGVPSDMAIDGAGFFIIQRGDEQLYTRDGAFRLDAENQLVTVDGDRVLGYAADEDFVVQEGTLGPLTIPIGQLTLAEATTEVRLSGNLNAAGDVATRGSRIRLGADSDSGFTLISDPTVPPTDPNVIEESSLLVEIADPDDESGDTPLFSEGQTIEVLGARKGGVNLPGSQFLIEATSTISDLLSFLGDALALQDTGENPDGNTPGASIDPETGELFITGNIGQANDLEIEGTDLRLLDTDGSVLRFPFSSERLAQADGESVRTTMVAYDSLGTAIEVDVSVAMVSKDDTGTTWRYFLESVDDTDLNHALGTGVIEFDNFGLLRTTDPITVSVDREGTGAATPMTFTLSLIGDDGEVTALTDVQSTLASTFRDGAPIGTLEDFTIDRDGTIMGAFSNTLLRPLGRVVLATFRNPEGLQTLGSNLLREAPNSGQATVVSPGELGAGQIVAGSLELSNVDLGREFINLILASTGYNASSRVIQTTDQLFDRLLALT